MTSSIEPPKHTSVVYNDVYMGGYVKTALGFEAEGFDGAPITGGAGWNGKAYISAERADLAVRVDFLERG